MEKYQSPVQPAEVPAAARVAAQARQEPRGRHLRHPTRDGILRIFCFFGLIVLLVFGLNGLINCGLRRIKTNQFGVFNEIVDGKVNAELIVSGSSRAFSHYDPRIIQTLTGLSAFNIGLNGSQTDMQLAMLKTYLDHNHAPRLIIQNLDAFSFVMTREVYDPAQYMPYLGQNDLYDALCKINPTVWRKCKYLPLYGYAVEDMRLDWLMAPLGLMGFSPRQTFYRGFDPRIGKWDTDFAKFQAANPAGVNFQVEPAGIQVLRDLIKACRERGIELIFVYSPEYRPMQDLTRNRAEIFGEFHTLSQEYSVPFWDFSDSAICMQQKYFNNSEHLNAEGAELFSTDLARRLARELPRLTIHEMANGAPPNRAIREVAQAETVDEGSNNKRAAAALYELIPPSTNVY